METSFSDQMDQDKLFPTLSAAQVARIGSHGRRRAIARGDVLMDVGDVRGGNVKRVASAVGEGSIAVAFVHHVLQAN